MPDYRKLLPTACIECVVDVMGWAETNASVPASGYLTLLSNHHHLWLGNWKARIKGAWKILRYKEMYPDIELNSSQEVQDLIDALTELKGKIWPENSIQQP